MKELTYNLTATSSQIEEGKVSTGKNELLFGVSKESNLPSPADLLISAFAACCLKNVERFSNFMKYTYDHASISVSSTRQDQPPMIRSIQFELVVFSEDDSINGDLLLRNLQKFGTIYNTLNAVCEIEGMIRIEKVAQ